MFGPWMAGTIASQRPAQFRYWYRWSIYIGSGKTIRAEIELSRVIRPSCEEAALVIRLYDLFYEYTWRAEVEPAGVGSGIQVDNGRIDIGWMHRVCSQSMGKYAYCTFGADGWILTLNHRCFSKKRIWRRISRRSALDRAYWKRISATRLLRLLIH